MERKKSLGQHFLHSAHYVATVADAAEVSPGDRVLEVGPGEGVLTHELLVRGACVVAVEKDHRLVPILKETFAEEIARGMLAVVEGDILEYAPNLEQGYKLVANIPYYITGAILKKFLSAPVQPARIVLLVQKEVAERIARDPKESILSLSIKAYGTPTYVHTVPRSAFSPPPEVDSAILRIDDISRKNFASAAQEENFFELVRAGFAHKRKLLVSNLKPTLGERAANFLEQAGIPQNTRAEDVKLEQWLALGSFK